jgi:hypothetical protein
MPLGWGIGRDDVGVNIPAQRPGGAADHIAEDIRRIREKYCVPPLVDPNPIVLGINQNLTLDKTQMKINAFVLTAISGTINLWIGNYSGQPSVGSIPHFQVAAGSPPIQIAMPEGGYTFTLQPSAAGAATGTLTLMAL